MSVIVPWFGIKEAVSMCNFFIVYHEITLRDIVNGIHLQY